MTVKTHQVRIERSGREFTVQEGESVLAGALRQGIVLPYGCRNGVCAACKCSVQGAVDYGTYDAKALTPEERAAGKALLCQAKPLEDIAISAREVVIPVGVEVKMFPARVVKLEQLAHDVMGVFLKAPPRDPIKFLPGQYIDILLREGSRRSFSLANTPQDDTFELHVRRVPDGKFTNFVFTELKEKDLLRLCGPLGTFFLRPETERSDKPILLIAGGTGFAPMKSIMNDVLARGLTRPIHFYWGVRSKRDLYMHELALGWQEQQPLFRYIPVLSEPRPEDSWTGRTGWVHDAAIADHPNLQGIDIYASGPPPMIAAIRATFPARGLAEDRLFYDSFDFTHETL